MQKISIENYLSQLFSVKTTDSYMYNINHFLKTNPKAKRYKYKDVLDYMAEVSKRNNNIHYRVRILSAIKKYYDYLIVSGLRTDHPCKRFTIKKNHNQAIQLQDLFSSEELQMLMNRENRYWFLEIRNKVLLGLLIYQGLTSEEIVRLELKDIDLDNGTIYIKASHTLNSRTLNLMPKQMIPLSTYINETRDKILVGKTDKLLLGKLGNPISVDVIHAVFDQFKGLFPDRKINPQTIRMSVISNWLNEKSIPLERVQELAGHKWPGTTEKYIKVDANAERELINKYFPI